MTAEPSKPIPAPAPIGNGKTYAALAAGAITTLVTYGLSFAGVTPPPDAVAAFQTLLTIAAVYFVPHGAMNDIAAEFRRAK